MLLDGAGPDHLQLSRGRLHSTSIFGDEKTGKMASELFTEDDVLNIQCGATMCYQIAILPMLLIGWEMNLLSDEDEVYFQEKLSLVNRIKDNVTRKHPISSALSVRLS